MWTRVQVFLFICFYYFFFFSFISIEKPAQLEKVINMINEKFEGELIEKLGLKCDPKLDWWLDEVLPEIMENYEIKPEDIEEIMYWGKTNNTETTILIRIKLKEQKAYTYVLSYIVWIYPYMFVLYESI